MSELKKQVCFALYSASNAVMRAYRPLLDKLDLTYTQYLVMLSLWARDEVSLKEIGRRPDWMRAP
jgi:DNA-binding MarR family transcriptional regulator